MKKSVVKAIALICALLMTVTVMSGCGNTNKELHERYGYEESFQYNDEMIGHALKSTVMQIRMTYSARVRYYPVTVDEQSIMQLMLLAYDEYGDEYDVDAIMEAVNTVIKEDVTEYLVYGTQKEVEISPMFTGSGVVISEDGYIATNSHVISLTEEEKNDIYVSALLTGVKEDLGGIVDSLGGYGMQLTDDDVEALYETIAYASVEDMQVIDENAYIEACFPTNDGNTSESAAKHYEAAVVAEGTQMGKDGLTQDTAILKIEQDNLVALALEEDYPEQNSKVVSAGFPGSANVIFKMSGSEEANLALSTSSGTISRLVTIEGTNYQAIGIDTNISNGSSGGPSVDYELKVEGLNTYAYAEDQRFANMVPAEYVNVLAGSFNIGQEDISKNFLTGLQLLQNGYGPAALECFEYIDAARPDTPYIKELITLAENAPDKEYPNNDWIVIVLIAVAAVVVIGAVVIFIVVLSSKGRKRKNIYIPPTSYGGRSGNNDLFSGSSSSSQGYNYNSNNNSDSWRL